MNGPVDARLAGRDSRPGGNHHRPITIAQLAGPPAVLALFATIALVATLAVFDTSRGVIVNAWLLAIGGLAVWTLWRALDMALATSTASAFDSARDRPPDPPTRLRDVIAMEGAILDAEWSWGGVEFRLRPILRRIAEARLTERHQVDLETDPAAARRILGEELWALIGPEPVAGHVPARPAGPLEPGARPSLSAGQVKSRGGRRGIPRATIRRAIEALEEL